MEPENEVIYSCPFIPAEWIAAHGLSPKRIHPRTTRKVNESSEGVCSYARAFINETAAFDANCSVIFTTVCDQMRRAPDLYSLSNRKPFFLMHVPTTWKNRSSWDLYKSELCRLSRFLCSIGGAPPSDEKLIQVMMDFNDRRRILRNARKYLPARKFSEAIMDFHYDGSIPQLDRPAVETGGVPLAVVGAPLLKPHLDLFDIVEKGGGELVLNATTSGERTMAAPFDMDNIMDDPLSVLVDAYFNAIPDAFRRPNDLLFSWLESTIRERDVKGVIFLRYTWCDTWRGEEQRIKEWCGLPLIGIDPGVDYAINKSAVNRIQSFLEILT